MPAPRRLDPLASLAAYFGSELRRLRKLHNWSQDELAEHLGWATATIAAIETAHRIPPEDLAEAADKLFGLPDMLTHLAELVRKGPRWFEHYKELEAQATQISIWIMNLIPGLFQTEDYARSLMQVGRAMDSPETIDNDLVVRMGRQRVLESDNPPRVWAVLHEAAVKQPIGSEDITRRQLQRLLELACRPNIEIQILPFAASTYPGTNGPFSIFTFDEHAPVAFLETPGRSGRVIDTEPEFSHYAWRYDRIRTMALSPEASKGLIMGAMNSIWIDPKT